MNKTDDGGPAYPYGDATHGGDSGMTLRDHFAAQVLTALIRAEGLQLSREGGAVAAYEIADAMIAARGAP